MKDANCVDERVRRVLQEGGDAFCELQRAKAENPRAYVTAPVMVDALAAFERRLRALEEPAAE